MDENGKRGREEEREVEEQREFGWSSLRERVKVRKKNTSPFFFCYY